MPLSRSARRPASLRKTTVAMAGADAEDLHEVGGGPKTGFETTLTVTTVEPYLAVQALDARGNVLAQSAVIRPGGLSLG